MQCPRCQQDNPSHAKFCLECGVSLRRTDASDSTKPSYTDLERDLTESLEQQTATREILRVIASSPTEMQPVFDTIADCAMRLCGGNQGLVITFDGELMYIGALVDFDTAGAEAVRQVVSGSAGPRKRGWPGGITTGRACRVSPSYTLTPRGPRSRRARVCRSRRSSWRPCHSPCESVQ
jgi:hypothetical protein